MAALKRIATVRKNVNVLQHLLGFFSKQLDAALRQELVTCIDDYHRSFVPLVVATVEADEPCRCTAGGVTLTITRVWLGSNSTGVSVKLRLPAKSVSVVETSGSDWWRRS